jgi:hypothetical protein
MTVLKYIRKGILIVVYYLLRSLFTIVNAIVTIRDFFRFRKTNRGPEPQEDNPVVEPVMN